MKFSFQNIFKILLLYIQSDIMATTEGDIADLGKRIGAALIDLIVVGIFGSLVMFFVIGGAVLRGVTTGNFSGMIGAPMLIGFLIFLLYFTLFEAFMNGQTLGKMLLKIRVVTVKGDSIGFTRSLIRNILRYVDMLPALYLLGFIIVAISEKNQRLGDMAAGTLVVSIP